MGGAEDERGRMLEAAREAAGRAGGLVAEAFGGQVPFRTKGSPHDLVSEVDIAAQEAAVACIRERFPGHAIVGEEAPPEADVRTSPVPVWLVDPVDGTTNFVRGVPFCSVSVAVALGGRVLAGVVLDPVRGEEFSAAAGGGAFLGRERLRASRCPSLEEAVVAVDAAFSVDVPGGLARLAGSCRAVRMLGSAALAMAYVAAGRLDAYGSTRLSPWDTAAATLLVREAGGRVTDLGGREYEVGRGPVLASCAPLSGPLAKAVGLPGRRAPSSTSRRHSPAR